MDGTSEITQALAEFVFGRQLPSEAKRRNSDPTETDDAAFSASSLTPEVTSLFIGDLARTVNEEDLLAVINGVGNVQNIDIKRDPLTRSNLGYGFITFKSRLDAEKVLKACNGLAIHGRPVRLGWAQKNTTLSVANLDEFADMNVVRQSFRAFGPLFEPDSFIRYGDVIHIRYRNRSDAEAAKDSLNQKLIGGCTLRIGWADQVVRKNCVFLQFDAKQAAHLSEDQLMHRMSEFGSVIFCNLPRDPATNRLKGYAFIYFEETEAGEEQATNAIQTISRTGKIDHLRVRCNYARRQANKSAGGVSDSPPDRLSALPQLRRLAPPQQAATPDNLYQQQQRNLQLQQQLELQQMQVQQQLQQLRSQVALYSNQVPSYGAPQTSYPTRPAVQWSQPNPSYAWM